MRFNYRDRFNPVERNERNLCRYLGVSELTEDDSEEKWNCLNRIWNGRRYWMKVRVNEYRRKMIWELYPGMNIPKQNRRAFEEYLNDCGKITPQIRLKLDSVGDVKMVGSYDIEKCIWSERDFDAIEDDLFEEIECRRDLILQLSKR